MHYRFFDGRTQPCEPFFIVPASFDAADHLPAKLHKRIDDAYYLLSLILWKIANHKAEADGLVLLKAKHLNEVMAKDHSRAVIESLLTAGVIHRDRYLVGEKPYGYRLDSRYYNDDPLIVPAKCPRLIRAWTSICRERGYEQRTRRLPIHDDLENMQSELTVDLDEVQEILGKVSVTCAQKALIETLASGRYFFSVGRFGRVTNSITSLQSELRCALRLNGKRLAQLDIKNSQPALLAQRLLLTEKEKKRENREGERTGQVTIYDSENSSTNKDSKSCSGQSDSLPDDLVEFAGLTEIGTFYDVCSKEMGINRTTFKEKFLVDVLAKAKLNADGAEYPSRVEDYFRGRFPSVYRELRRINGDGWEHSNGIRLLQTDEAGLVIHTVCPALRIKNPKVPFLTIHDSVLPTVDETAAVEDAFNEAFEAKGFRLTLKLSTDLRKEYLDNPRERKKRRRRKSTNKKGVAA